MSEQCRLQRFGKSDVDGIIGGEVVAKHPHSRQQNGVRVPPDWKCKKIIQGRLRSLRIEIPCENEPSNNLDNLDV